MMPNERETFCYEDLRDTVPYDLPPKRRAFRKLHIWQVLLFFAAAMILFYFLGSMAQYYLGMGGVLLSQLGFLVLSLAFVLLMRANPREVFPLRKPKAAALAGVLVVWVGVFLASEAMSFLILVFAPKTVLEISQSMNNTLFGTGFSAVLVVLIVSVAPAICEEAMHRGVILAGIRTDLPRHRAIAVLLSGLIFGIFHLYPVRMLPTALIGCVMAYLVLATGNMIYSAFLHLVHNGLLMIIQALATRTVSSDMMQQSAQLLQSLPRGFFGIYIIMFGAPAPFFLYLGCWIVRRATSPVRLSFLPKGRESRTLAYLLGSTIAVVLGGILIFLV